MDKNTNIIDLYNKLDNKGAKGKAHIDIGLLCSRTTNSVKQNWFSTKQFPTQFQDQIINYLQTTIRNQN